MHIGVLWDIWQSSTMNKREELIMKKKTWMQIVTAVFIILAGVMIHSQSCYAVEETEITVNSFYQVNTDTQMKENASESAQTVQELKAGDTVMVTAYADGAWCMASIGDKTGYVHIAELTPIGNVDNLNAEFNSIGNDYESIYEEVLELQRQKKNRMIWGSIIVVLVVAIFGVGIVSAVKKNKEEQNQKQQSQEEKE